MRTQSPSRALVGALLDYVRRREQEVDIDVGDLHGLDMDSPAFQITMQHGMATALHELEHLLRDVEGLPLEQLGTEELLTLLSDAQSATMRRVSPDQAGFWTREWYDGEREIDERRARGEHGAIYMSDEEFQAALDRVAPADVSALDDAAQPRYSMLVEWSDEDQAYLVTLPEWAEEGTRPATYGETYAEAVANGQEVLDLLVKSAREARRALPPPRVFARRA